MYPQFVEANGKQYKINTDFRYAIECEEIAKNNNIDGFERALAIIYILLGDEAIDDGLKKGNEQLYEKLLELLLRYLLCDKKYDTKNNEKPDMNFKQDMDYIEASFMSDYHIDLANTEMHWWKFQKLISGLSDSELGNCCVLNRVRNLRNLDITKIKDKEQRDKLSRAKKEIALKSEKKKPTKKEIESANNLFKQLGIERK